MHQQQPSVSVVSLKASPLKAFIFLFNLMIPCISECLLHNKHPHILRFNIKTCFLKRKSPRGRRFPGLQDIDSQLFTRCFQLDLQMLPMHSLLPKVLTVDTRPYPQHTHFLNLSPSTASSLSDSPSLCGPVCGCRSVCHLAGPDCTPPWLL